ncbi:MAG: GntR family transcriptional regulator [Actinoallomurus sp.]
MWEDDLDHESGRTLYLQIADRIEERILGGDLPPDRAIPSAGQMAQIWGVSRDTARSATRILVERGLVYTVVGKGSYVTPAERRPGS